MFALLGDLLETLLVLAFVLAFFNSKGLRRFVGQLVLAYVVGIVGLGMFLVLLLMPLNGVPAVPCLGAAGLIALAFVLYIAFGLRDANRALTAHFRRPPPISNPITSEECEALLRWCAQNREDDAASTSYASPPTPQRQLGSGSARAPRKRPAQRKLPGPQRRNALLPLG